MKIETGKIYKRMKGRRDTVRVLAVSNDYVKIRDSDGIHFVPVLSFPKYFIEVDKK